MRFEWDEAELLSMRRAPRSSMRFVRLSVKWESDGLAN